MGGDQSKLVPRVCNIILMGNTLDQEAFSEFKNLPFGAKLLAKGRNLEELLQDNADCLQHVTVIVNAFAPKEALEPVVSQAPKLVWIHSLSAGIDHMLYPGLVENPNIVVSTAKGIYNSSLAEYVMAMILYFAKNVARLNQQKAEKKWERFYKTEIKGKTMGIVGYGDIGVACATLAKGAGMRVVALRRNPDLSSHDPLIDKVYSPLQLVDVMQESDYLVIAAPLTSETIHMFDKKLFRHCKKGQILINIGRGRLIVEEDLIEALKDGTLAGAALDVFATEPLPETSPIWDLPNVVISPHSADMVEGFIHKSVSFFCENCVRFLNKQPVKGLANKQLGY